MSDVTKHTFEFGDEGLRRMAGIQDWNVGACFAHNGDWWRIVESIDLDPRKGAVRIVALKIPQALLPYAEGVTDAC